MAEKEKDIDRKEEIRESAADIVFESEVRDEEKTQELRSALEEAEDVLGPAFGSNSEVDADDIEERLRKKSEKRRNEKKNEEPQEKSESILQKPKVRNTLFFSLAVLLLVVIAFTAPFSPLRKKREPQKPIKVSLIKEAPKPPVQKNEQKPLLPQAEKPKAPEVRKEPTPPEVTDLSLSEESLKPVPEERGIPSLAALPTPPEETKENEVAPPLSEIQKLQEGLQEYKQDLKDIKQTIERLSQTIGALSERTENVEKQLEELRKLSHQIGQVQETTEKFGVRLEKLEKQVLANTGQLREIYQQLAKKRKKMRILDPYSVEIEGVVYEIGSVLKIKGKKFVITEIDPKRGVYLVDKYGNKWLLEP